MESTNQSFIESSFQSSDYNLMEKIGEGGFGHVYKALQYSTQKIVAIKFLVLSPEFELDKKRRYIERFHRESDLTRRLSHPNIVQLLDKGEQDDALIYAVYEFVDGHTLKDQLDNQGALSAVDAAEVMACVLDALSHAHDEGVIHRDIKPANIMLYKVGAKTHVKVLDFGIGTLKHDVRQNDYKSITLTQETLGTPSYSAPEQLRGEPPVIQTDIYVWGLVFLECLTGVPAITGRSLASIFHQQLSPTNVPLGVLAGHSSANFLRRVLNKKSHLRPSKTADLYHEFCKFNFSSLTGDLSAHTKVSRGTEPSTTQIMVDNADTVISDGRFVFSQLTERKQISVLSVILTTQSMASDANKLEQIDQDVIDTFHSDQMQQCIDIVIRFGGCHVGSLGDSLLFYFGYPSVTDNDSRLCSRAALEIASNFNKKNALLKNTQGLISHIQMGLQIGLMLSLDNSLPEGKAAHDAMNLCRQATFGQILCSDKVKSILESYINFELVTPDEPVNGLQANQPNTFYSLMGERQSEAFGFLRRTQKHWAFVGREKELALLENMLVSSNHRDESNTYSVEQNQQLESAAKFAHIQGEAGIGKSRIVFELRLRAPHSDCLVAQCLPEHQNNALYPILNLLKFKYSLIGLSDKLSLLCLRNALELTSLSQEEQYQGLFVLAAWLNIHTDTVEEGESVLSNLSPALQKQRLFAVLCHLFCQKNYQMADSITNPYLYIFEDLHWSDPTSLEFIQYLIQSDEFTRGQHAWVNTSREALPETLLNIPFIMIIVEKLAQAQTQEFINHLFDGQTLATGLNDLILERTDGIPLFIEELVSSLNNQKLVHKVNGIYDFVDSETHNQVPATLRDSLQQRLDSLHFAKDTAQLAATIGRTFDYELLVAASSKDEAQIQSDLDELIKTELVFRQRKTDGDSYIFKHALVRDAAYESMERETCRNAHLSIAYIIEERSKIENSSIVELTEHFSKASSFSKAITYGVMAAHNYLEKLLLDETVYLCNKVLIWIGNLKYEQVESKIEINRILTQAAMSKKGWGHSDVFNLIHNSKEYFSHLKPEQYNEKVLWAMASSFSYYYVVGDRQGMLELHRYMREFLKGEISSGLKSVVFLIQGFIYYNDANFTQSERSFNSSISLFNVGEDERVIYLFGLDVLVWAKSILSIVYWNQGKFAKSKQQGLESIQRAKTIGHTPTICIALLYQSIVHQYNADKSMAKQSTDEILELSQKYDLPAYAGYASLINLWAVDNHDMGLVNVIVDGLRNAGCNTSLAFYESLATDMLIESGQFKLAKEILDKCLLSCKRSHELPYEAELFRKRAFCLLNEGDSSLHSEAFNNLNTAINLAKERGINPVLQNSKVTQNNLLKLNSLLINKE